jgi:3-carboxy-cis,cis-muconate cycloisomerase
MDAQHARGLLDLLFSTEEMRLVFSDHGRLQGMLDFERALARAEGRLGVIPAQAAEVIARPRPPAAFDLAALASEAEQAGNLAIPLIRALTALVARDDAEAARYVHWGATSQDVIDTGLMLQMRAGLELLDDDLARLAAALAQLAQTYRATPMAGRTWLQQAAPTTFGLRPLAGSAPSSATSGGCASCAGERWRRRWVARSARWRPLARRGWPWPTP